MRPELNNILLIDDNKNDLELVQYHLDKRFDGLMYIFAESLADFEEKFTWIKPDLIICDFYLNDGTGLDILIKVREQTDIPFIFMSGSLKDQEDSISKTILNGANSYVLKENIHKLPEVVDFVMGKESLRQQKKYEREILKNKAKIKIQKTLESLKTGRNEKNLITELEEAIRILDEI